MLVNFKLFYRFNAFTLKHTYLLIIDTESRKGNSACLRFKCLVQKLVFFFKHLFLTKQRGKTFPIYLKLLIYPILKLQPERKNMLFLQITANFPFQKIRKKV